MNYCENFELWSAGMCMFDIFTFKWTTDQAYAVIYYTCVFHIGRFYDSNEHTFITSPK